jgi:hypothetical protein
LTIQDCMPETSPTLPFFRPDATGSIDAWDGKGGRTYRGQFSTLYVLILFYVVLVTRVRQLVPARVLRP